MTSEHLQHPNQMTSPWFPTYHTSREAVLQDDLGMGRIISGNYLPFTARLIDVEVDVANKRYRQVVVPATMDELQSWWKAIGIFQVDGSELDEKSREEFARKVAAELWQESWIAGVPADATIFCAACQEQRPAHGSNFYDADQLCNRCVEHVEVLMAQRTLVSVASWVQDAAAGNKLRQAIRELERKGTGIFSLPDGRYLEASCLYRFNRNAEVKEPAKDHWPYPDMEPGIYHGYARSNWEPGQYFNAPDEEIYFTDANNLLHYLETGELPSRASRNPRRKSKQNGHSWEEGYQS
jgi:hypothetical protein